jgi:hypothetical protein
MVNKVVLGAAVIALAVAVLPAAAEEEDEWELELRTEDVWFLCGEHKVQNVDDLEQRYATWDTTPPDESVADGAGCGSVDSVFTNTQQHNPYDSTWVGDFDGNLDTLTVEVHNIYLGPARVTEEFEVAVRLYVDGLNLFGELGDQLVVPAVRSSTGLSEMIRFTITDIGLVEERDDRLHHIALVLHGGTPHHREPTITDTLSGWVWGTTEVPSGITFNPEEPEDTILSAVD